jgi:UDP-2,3-diacylglucosamine hydrolase
MQTLLLSDLHLSEQSPKITSYFELFINYCHENNEQIENIYILGDFFEFWVGDDYQSPLSDHIFQQLASISQYSHIHCFFMHGNRDFMLSTGFEEKTGFSIIDDPSIIKLDKEPVLLAHGDSLCTDDVTYQKTRAMLRSKKWKDEMLAKTIPARIQIALAARKHGEEKQKDQQSSNTDTKHKEEIADVNDEAVNDLLRQNQCKVIIHGHTHRPQTHHFDLDGQQAQRIVLAAWYEKGSFLKYENKEYSTVIL